MVRCPKCQATLPDFAVHCQFCGQDFANPTNPAASPGNRASKSGYSGGVPSWVWPAYYGVAGWWVLSGLYTIISSIYIARAGGSGGIAGDIGGVIGMFVLLIGFATALVGLGLLVRFEPVRGLVNILCFLQILTGLRGLLIGFFLSGILGFLGILSMLYSILQIVLACFMIYLIGETDSRAPNF